ncbi:hypothetical protein [Pseudomonas japonica]|uniref:hypothetical protein n=1 Tax=Pseudomonas japonica TaxID=256466 RepID=UPI0015E35275|nr:hypothetical protein [Pseudomonas japonica]MBA1245875.1 hypothetical protein [Pseudomonas japonica]
MSLRRLENVSKSRQSHLEGRFSWLAAVIQGEEFDRSRVLWVSVFDHWLSREDANALLENIPPEEESRRNMLLEGFCGEMIANTEVLSFAMRRHGRCRPVFRSFKSKDMLLGYCRPGGGTLFGHPRRYGFRHRHFQVALPEFGCIFQEYWDSTYYFYSSSPQLEEAARRWAARTGVYILNAADD